MPPETKLIPIPQGWGRDARVFMEAHGFTPSIPEIRSSDAFRSPFQYYLSRILGLRPIYSYYEPFSIGGWAHTFLQLYYTSNRDQRFLDKIKDHQTLISEVAEAIRMPHQQKADEIQRAYDDAIKAKTIVEVGFNIRLKGNDRTINDILTEQHGQWRPLAQELQLTVDHGKTKLAAQLDLLMYNDETQELRIPDLKTTDTDPTIRAEMCPVEYQTLHYMHIVNACIPELIEKFNLGARTRLKDMVHLVIQKPSIKFGSKDRDYTEYEHVISRGDRKGQVEIRRKYDDGPPKPENFHKRITEYMLGQGEYIDKEIDRQENPMAGISYTRYDRLDPNDWANYSMITRSIYDMATTEPEPRYFMRNARAMVDRGQLTPYALFYRLPVAAWPDLIKRNNMIIDRRPVEHMQEMET
jgi:hypothetical protein